ncbi:hypothetical protein V5O48_014764 [Marasmius crinis-equi]|uniref:Uncharacterized protein n=1 Tax=Marasmius crinis-equi TaxID=585013 RepID=A0ABR3EWQ5_9AGAR
MRGDDHQLQLRTTRAATPPRFSVQEEVSIQLELRGKVESDWLSARGWSGAKITEIVHLRRQARERRLVELESRLEEACEESDLVEKCVRRTNRVSVMTGGKQVFLGGPRSIQNQRLALKYKGDFKRARREISDLFQEISALREPDAPTLKLKKRFKQSPEVDELACKVDKMVMQDTEMKISDNV